MSERPNARRGWLVLLVWVMVAFFYFTITWDYIRTNWNDRKFLDYMQYVAQVIAEDRRSANDARTLLEVRARELGLPVRSEDIVVLGGGGTALTIALRYEVDIQIPIFERGIYKKQYQHKVTYKPLQ